MPTDHANLDRRRDRRSARGLFQSFGVYLHLYIVIGLAVPVMIYVVMMQSFGWRMPVFGMNGVLTYAASSNKALILYASPSTKDFLAGVGGNYDFLLTPWRDYLADRKLRYEEVKDTTRLKALEGGVLILPSAIALSPEERTEILAFRTRGGAVLATWATGSRNAKGEWDGWQFLESMGGKVVGELQADADANHLILNGESPVSHSQLAGQRLFMTKTSESLLRLKGEMVAGRFMNWARIPSNERRDEGAVVFSEPSPTAGRAVVFGFAESTWANHPKVAYALFDDVITWLQREPSVVRAAWPNGKLAANAVEMDTEEGFPNALNFSTMMQAVDYPSTFFVLTSVAKKFPDVLKQLHQNFEIGYHADQHFGFAKQSEATQQQRIQVMRADMASIIPDTTGILGFRAPTESYDATTEKLLQRAGVRYHVADPNRSEGRLPVMAKVEGTDSESDLVVLPRTQRDDINLIGAEVTLEQLQKALIDDTELVLNNAALGLLSVHTQNFGADSLLRKALPGYLVQLKERKSQMWLASTGQVAQWWRARERFKLSSRDAGRRLEFDISITGDTPVRGATVMLMLPQKGVPPTVEATKIGGIKPVVVMVDAYRAAIVFDMLKPGNYAYQVTFTR